MKWDEGMRMSLHISDMKEMIGWMTDFAPPACVLLLWHGNEQILWPIIEKSESITVRKRTNDRAAQWCNWGMTCQRLHMTWRWQMYWVSYTVFFFCIITHYNLPRETYPVICILHILNEYSTQLNSISYGMKRPQGVSVGDIKCNHTAMWFSMYSHSSEQQWDCLYNQI